MTLCTDVRLVNVQGFLRENRRMKVIETLYKNSCAVVLMDANLTAWKNTIT
jgi:hypothetical protein